MLTFSSFLNFKQNTCSFLGDVVYYVYEGKFNSFTHLRVQH